MGRAPAFPEPGPQRRPASYGEAGGSGQDDQGLGRGELHGRQERPRGM